MSAPRLVRVQDQIKKEISEVVQTKLRDPGVGFVTFTEVNVSPDLRQATVFFSVLGSETEREKSFKALKRAAGFIQQELGKRMRMRFIPRLEFRYDSSAEYGGRIDKIIEDLHSQDENRD